MRNVISIIWKASNPTTPSCLRMSVVRYAV
jgi:hypothetical protein